MPPPNCSVLPHGPAGYQDRGTVAVTAMQTTSSLYYLPVPPFKQSHVLLFHSPGLESPCGVRTPLCAPGVQQERGWGWLSLGSAKFLQLPRHQEEDASRSQAAPCPLGQGAQGELGQSTHCKGRPRGSLAGCQVCRQHRALCPAGSISHGSIPTDMGWQHTVSPWHRAGSALGPPSSEGMPSLCAGGPSWSPACHLPEGIAGAGRGSLSPRSPSLQSPPNGESYHLSL